MNYQSVSARIGRLTYKWRQRRRQNFSPAGGLKHSPGSALGAMTLPPLPAASPRATARDMADTNKEALLHAGQISR